MSKTSNRTESILLTIHSATVNQLIRYSVEHTLTISIVFFALNLFSYFFEKPVQKCDVHQKNLAKSLNELYTEPAPSTLFPFDIPNEFPLTRSVSTTTEIFSNCSGGFGNSQKSLKALTPQPNKRMAMHNARDAIERTYRSVSRSGSRDSIDPSHDVRSKSKDELFSEFCKKAGQRPRPKDIYFIDQSTYDDEAEGNVFVVDNYATIRKNRRNSKSSNVFNSNLSLKDTNNINSNGKSFLPKNIFDAGSFGGSTERDAVFLNNNYFSQSRSSSRDSNLYQSRTLPRDFMKRNVEFVLDNDAMSGRRVSASGLYTPYNNSITLTSPNVIPKAAMTNMGTDEYYRKSYDPLTSRNSRQCDAYAGSSEDTRSVHWPNAIPGSPSSFSNRSKFRANHADAIYSPREKPKRMSSFYSQHFPQPQKKQQTLNSFTNDVTQSDNEDETIVDGIDCNGDVDGGDSMTSGGSDEYGIFDLDRMEKERRQSHASLFQVDAIDFVNGTPV